MLRRLAAACALLSAVLLSGCATAATAPAAQDATPAPTPTAACPQVEGAELPPECAGYDPDSAMAQNDRHRERMDLGEDGREAADALVEPLTAALETVRTGGDISSSSITTAVMDAGLPAPQLVGAAGSFAFGVAAPEGGCLFGGVTADAVTVEVGGYIMDGGCLPMQ